MTDMPPLPTRPSQPSFLETRADFRALFARRVAIGATVLFALMLLAGIAYLVVVVRDAQIDSTTRGKDIQSTARIIKDCTDPDGDCYKQGQRRTAGAVADINRVVILAAACSVGLSPDMAVVERQAAIQSCVLDRLARDVAAHP